MSYIDNPDFQDEAMEDAIRDEAFTELDMTFTVHLNALVPTEYIKAQDVEEVADELVTTLNITSSQFDIDVDGLEITECEVC